jgi:L-threonylcarbamoyladenylate synthase
MSAKIVSAEDPRQIAVAAEILRQGGLVAFPTETVYGLGADAFNAKAVCRVFEVKKRPQFDPLIVHVAKADDVRRLWDEIPGSAEELMKRFWPGPLTLVLPKKEEVPDLVTAGLPSVAVRMPRNPAALSLIEQAGGAVAAPSANLYGYTSPTSAEAVLEDLGDGVDLVLDGGPTEVGIESTVLKPEKGEGILLRLGAVSSEDIQKIIPVSRLLAVSEGHVESPGQMKSHYAPWTGLDLMDRPYEEWMKELFETHRIFEEKGVPWPRLGFLSFGVKPETALLDTVEHLSVRQDLYEVASNLFRAIRKLDKMHLDYLMAERVPARGIGNAINDRLEKAAAGHSGIRSFLLNLIQ